MNAAVLNSLPRDDYVGHMVVIYGIEKDIFWLHDPGLKPHRSRQTSRQELADAWFWSGAKTAGLVAVKKD